MRILLIGEYSRLHNSLKEGLEALGHEVCLVGTGDYFKNFPVDIKLHRSYDTGIAKKIKVGLYKLFKIDLTSRLVLKQFLSYAEQLKDYDIVQLINESPLGIQAAEEKKAIEFLKKYNKNIFLLSCGADYSNLTFAIKQNIRYSILTPLLEQRVTTDRYEHALKYLKTEYQDLHHYLYKEVIQGVIASDIDYLLALEKHEKFLGLIPNPVNTDILTYQPVNNQEKLRIFLGINSSNYYKKGMDFFEKALVRLQEKFPDKIEVLRVHNLAYKDYIEQYNTASILLDQVYSFDQGYNALEAMAKGKVVFTGAETEWLNLYQQQENHVCINAIADVDYLVEKISWLIENPKQIEKISLQARAFIEEHHHYKKVAGKYLDTWKAAMR